MTANMLKLNDDKTQFIIFETKQLAKIGEVSLQSVAYRYNWWTRLGICDITWTNYSRMAHMLTDWCTIFISNSKTSIAYVANLTRSQEKTSFKLSS